MSRELIQPHSMPGRDTYWDTEVSNYGKNILPPYSALNMEAVHFSERLVATYPPFHNRETHKLCYNAKVAFELKKIS
jgi:hypothetical protein